MLKQRLVFGALGIVLALAVLIFTSAKFIGCAVAALALIALYEFYKVTGLFEKKSPAAYLGFVFSLIVFFMGVFLENIFTNYLLMFTIVAYVLFLMITMVFFHGKCSFKDISVSFMGSAYITLFFMHIIFIRISSLGNLNIWLLFITAWASDTFAYFAGRTMGKHKLCPKISPKKTIEGAIGGIIGSIVCIALYSFFISKYNALNANYFNAVLFALLTAVFSQLGDLAASCIKREHDVKDYGNLIPGHGGILDRFDSVLLIAPLAYYMIAILPILTPVIK